MKFKVIELVKEREAKDYGLKRRKGYDYLNVNRPNFKPSALNPIIDLFDRNMVIYENPFLIKKPHKVKRGDVIEIEFVAKVK